MCSFFYFLTGPFLFCSWLSLSSSVHLFQFCSCDWSFPFFFSCGLSFPVLFMTLSCSVHDRVCPHSVHEWSFPFLFMRLILCSSFYHWCSISSSFPYLSLSVFVHGVFSMLQHLCWVWGDPGTGSEGSGDQRRAAGNDDLCATGSHCWYGQTQRAHQGLCLGVWLALEVDSETVYKSCGLIILKLCASRFVFVCMVGFGSWQWNCV